MTNSEATARAGGAWPAIALVFVTVTTGLLAILVNLLNYHNYPLLRSEVGIVVLALLAVGAGAAGLHRLAQPRLSFLFTGLYVAVLVDLGAEIGDAIFPFIVGGVSLVAYFRERVVLKLTTAAFVSVLVFQLFGTQIADSRSAPSMNEAKRQQAKEQGNPNLPPIVHLVLDSYIGLDGMSAADTNFGALRPQQEQFYLAHGFQIYPGAYSRHAKTINSLPEFLSYGKGGHAAEPRNVQFTSAPPLAYFIDLDRKGYRTSVLTPSFVDLCKDQPLTWCHNYNRSDLSTLAGADLPMADRARVIGATMLELSQFTAILAGTADLKLAALTGSRGRHLYNRAKLYSLTGLHQLDTFSRDLETLRYGEVRFVHLLIPHDPYMMNGECRLVPEPDWIDEHGPASHGKRDAAFARQARCMTDMGLSKMLAALDRTDAGRAAIVIVQGDHGSRTVDSVPFAGDPAPSKRAMTVSHSAFFAIRVPGQPPALVGGRFALDELIGGFAASGFTNAPRPVAGQAEVYLMDQNWIPARRANLPPFTQKLPKN